jgi:hypothetical protein
MPRWNPPRIEAGVTDASELEAAFDGILDAINDTASGGSSLDATNLPDACIPPDALATPNGFLVQTATLADAHLTAGAAAFEGQRGNLFVAVYPVGVLDRAVTLIGWSVYVQSLAGGPAGPCSPLVELLVDGSMVSQMLMVDGVQQATTGLSISVSRGAEVTIRVTEAAAANAHHVLGRAGIVYTTGGW